MDRIYYIGNRRRFYDMMETESLAAIFAGEELWKTGDEYYPFFADRNFVYLTGLKCKSAVLLAAKAANGQVSERLYLLPPDELSDLRESGAVEQDADIVIMLHSERKNQALRIFVF